MKTQTIKKDLVIYKIVAFALIVAATTFLMIAF
jgi:hypothetical protein